ncbi:MAG: iron-sulfur cluster-binding protein [Alphaproteobacteria bacterium]|nr:iron-sulfur cluster-binding protein [Alphaproteobacteria bacterium]
MSTDAREFPQGAHKALRDPRLQSSLLNLREGFQTKRAVAFAGLADPEGLREQARAIRASALGRLDELLLQFEARVTANGGHVHWARDADEARRIITAILKERGARAVSKGKSMVSEEIELNAHLTANGIAPIETDLGEYIIQLRNEKPTHIVAPAFHLQRDQVEESFRAAHTALDPQRDLDNRPALVREARGILRRHFEAADAGITGANFLIAETGTAIIVTNEGNGDLTRLLPKTHIVVTGIEKVIPTLDDMAILLRLLTRSATGQEITSYVSLMSGPKREGDADGPESFHVVLIDNGRATLLAAPTREILQCIRCGACMNHCPVYGVVGGHAYGAVYPGPLGAALDPGLDGMAKTYHLPNASSFCGRCETVCPVKIPLTRIMRHWRNEAFASGIPSPMFARGLRFWAAVARRPRLYRVAAGLAASTMRLLAGRKGRLSKFPVFSGWFAVRDLAKPAASSFQAQWRKKK